MRFILRKQDVNIVTFVCNRIKNNIMLKYSINITVLKIPHLFLDFIFLYDSHYRKHEIRFFIFFKLCYNRGVTSLKNDGRFVNKE